MSEFVNYVAGKLKDFPLHKTDYGVLVHADNMDIMKKFRMENYFDLLLTDPPYGIGEDGAKNHSRGNGTGFDKYKGNKRKAVAEARLYTPKDWDRETPGPEYFQEAMRISKNQIIFGGNYFQSIMIEDRSSYRIIGDEVIYGQKPALGKTNCWIVWDKMNGGTHFADCELAWASFDTAVRKYDYKWNGMLQHNMKKKEDRIHPTQKPIGLFIRILKDYTEEGFKVIDTHSGSGTTAIACIENKLNYLVIEKDKEYFEESSKRIEYFKYGWSSRTKDNSKKSSASELPQSSLKL